jgi:hypothetical protein
MLRQRRAPNTDTVLPLHSSPSSGGIGLSPRRPRKARNACFWSAVCCFGCLTIVSVLVYYGGMGQHHVSSVVNVVHSHIKGHIDAHHHHHHHEKKEKNVFERVRDHVEKKLVGDRRKKITCIDGSVGYVNDDYCDCPDGLDEPETSACSHILVNQRVFACKDGSKSIFASRLGDGVKDCKDGSDEERTLMNLLPRRWKS